MGRAHVRTRQLTNLRRDFERSRLEDLLVAAAYELALPIGRRSLPATPRTPEEEVNDQPPTATGGLSA